MLTATPVTELITSQRIFFATGKTKDVNFRIAQLKKLKQAIKERQNDILSALKADLNKPEFESFFELVVTQDIDHALKQIKSWVKPKKAKVNLNLLPGSARIIPEPLGAVLIIGPWNYPFSLMISPLIGAIAAGNCAILKPSEVTPHTSHVVAKLIQENFDPCYLTVVEGAVETAQQLLAENFDHIFFTGGTKVGKIIMEAAAKNLTPVTLELGGKSPCVVDTKIDIKETAKRITWGKFINAGQTCIAPDYLLVNRQIKADLVTEIKQCIEKFYGTNPAESPDFARIISDRQFNRLQSLLQLGQCIAEILAKYKEQQCTERGFRFLKDPLFFADSVFLKSPERIETMAMLMGLCLLVYNLGQRELRSALKQCNTGIKNQLGKLTNTPTKSMDFTVFSRDSFCEV